MQDFGKFLVISGIVMVALGLLLWSGFGKSWLGRLPGDIHYTRDNFSFHFPIVSCLLISVALTLLLWLFRKGESFSPFEPQLIAVESSMRSVSRMFSARWKECCALPEK